MIKIKFFWIFLIVMLWSILFKLEIFNPILFPSPSSVITALGHSFLQEDLHIKLAYSISFILKGLALGFLVACILVIFSLNNKYIESLSDTLASMLDPLPSLAILPIVILWFGTGKNSIIFIILHSVIWPVMVNIKSGIKTQPIVYRELADLIGINKLQRFFEIQLIGALPSVITGLKVAWARAWRALIGAEMIFGAIDGKSGIGYYIFEKRVFMDTNAMYASLIVIVLLGALVDYLFSVFENKTLKKWGMI